MLLFSLFFAVGAFATAMSGTYTVCSGGGCNYSTIGSALSDLKTNGVSGPVVISIAKGTYKETLSISSSISGVSSTNTITFEGAGAFNTIITSASSTVITILTGSYITFRTLELDMSGTSSGYGVSLGSGAKYINFIKCNITTGGSASTYNSGLEPVYLSSSSHCLFDSCVITGSGYACVDNRSTSGITFSHCDISNFYEFALYNSSCSGCVYNSNYIDSGGVYGPYSDNENGATYENNIIPCNSSSYWYYGMLIEYPNSSSTSVPFVIVNNIIGPNFYNDGLYFINSTTSANVKIQHNTINAPSASSSYSTDMYINNNGSGIDIRNNELSYTSGGSGYCLYFATGTSGISLEDGNNFYNLSGNLVYLSSSAVYSSLSSYQSAVTLSGFAAHDMNMQPIFVSSNDFHYSTTSAEPYSPYCGIDYDIDGDKRCKLFPSAGADESNYGKAKLYKGISGPDTAFVSSPTTYYSSVPTGAPISYSWYINSIFISDSSALTTNKLKAPGDTVKLITKGCAGSDTTKYYVVVDPPAYAPTTDFLASANTIEQYDTVIFADLSTNGPSAWHWKVTPSTYSYIYGDSTSQNPQIQFDSIGTYTICLTAANARGRGNSKCRTAFITVLPNVTLCHQSEVTEQTGYVYDDGGRGGNLGYNVGCGTFIKPCADTAYLVFDMFDMDCNYAYLQVLDGIGGNPLNSKRATSKQGANGFSGGNGGCTTSSPVLGDTFISPTGKFYLYESTAAMFSGFTPTPGFAAHWWSHAIKFPKPIAKFHSVNPSNDSVCVNNSMTFVADTTSAPNGTFLWDLDGDTTNGFESSGKSVQWPYFSTGTYKIRLVATNCGGSDTARIVIRVVNPVKPKANFWSNNTNPTTDDIVNFYPIETMCIDTYTWVFTGPSGSSYSFVGGSDYKSEYPQITFNDTGCWSVKLTAKNSAGTSTVLKNCYIHVKEPYCTPSVANQVATIGISKVKLNTLNNSATNNRTGYNNFITSDSTTLQSGIKYTLTIDRSSNINSVDLAAWIDWNGDAVFGASERILYISSSSGTGWNTTITVPKNAYLGATVLRVAINKGGLGDKVCGPDNFGDYEDYRVNIIPDNILPVITLYGSDTDIVYTGTKFTDPGYIALDSAFGNITGAVKVSCNKPFSSLKEDTFMAYYNVKDSFGLTAKTVTRLIIVENYTTSPIIGLCGNDTVKVAVDSPYTDKGVCSAHSQRYGNLLYLVTKSGSVNTNVVGAYSITFKVCDSSGNCTSKKRYVNVIDTTAPVLTLYGSDTVIIQAGAGYTHPILKVTDNYYKSVPITGSGYVDTTTPGIYHYTYFAKDGSGNISKSIKIVFKVVDTLPPLIVLNGKDTVILEVYNTYTDAGAQVYDNFDASPSLTTGGTYFADFPTGYAKYLGRYTVTYTGKDIYGNTAVATRHIFVVDNIPPTITLNGTINVNTCRWQPYVDTGYVVSDNYTPSSQIKIDTVTNLDITNTGVYYMYYNATDSAGNTIKSNTRNIYVSEEGACSWVNGIKRNKTLDNYINIYPNPGSGEFVIDINLPANEQAMITVTDLMGQTIKQISGEMGSQKQMLSLSSMADGIYFVNIYAGGQSTTKKIMLQR